MLFNINHLFAHKIVFLTNIAQLAKTVEYTNCMVGEEARPPPHPTMSVQDMTLNNMTVRF